MAEPVPRRGRLVGTPGAGSWLALTAAVGVAALAVALLAGRVPPWALGAGLAVWLVGLAGLVGWRVRDLVRARELERQLVRSQRDYEQLFNIVPCYISVQGRDYRIQESNELFRDDFGGHRAGEHCFRVYKGRDSICPNCPVEKTFDDGGVHSSEEVVVTRDGHRANVIVYSMPVRADDGRIAAVMEVSTNISEVKQLQRELAMMGLAVAGMAHRVKNILMGLEGGIFVVNTGFEEEDDETVGEGWEMVERNVERVSRVVKDLLYCAKDRAAERRDGVSPCAIVRDVHGLFRDRTSSEVVALRLQLDGDERVGSFDPDGLHSLLVNLVANAFDACRFDTTAADKQHVIELRCRHEAGGAVLIEVADNGAGIPADATDKVFRGFFSSKGTAGTGLGLLVVQRVVAAHGGTVSFTSEEGRGTTFTVELPPHDQTADPPSEDRGGSET